MYRYQIIPLLLRRLMRYSYMLIFLTVLAGCGATNSYSGYLRGDELLYLRLPIKAGRQESLVYGSQRFAGRSFDPVTLHTHVNHVAIPEPLWANLENLSHQWCSQPPIEARRPPSEIDFVVVFQCGQVANPINAIRAADLPSDLGALIDLVPSTDARLIDP